MGELGNDHNDEQDFGFNLLSGLPNLNARKSLLCKENQAKHISIQCDNFARGKCTPKVDVTCMHWRRVFIINKLFIQKFIFNISVAKVNFAEKTYMVIKGMVDDHKSSNIN